LNRRLVVNGPKRTRRFRQQPRRPRNNRWFKPMIRHGTTVRSTLTPLIQSNHLGSRRELHGIRQARPAPTTPSM
jgi:hypothetical protein